MKRFYVFINNFTLASYKMIIKFFMDSGDKLWSKLDLDRFRRFFAVIHITKTGSYDD